MPRNLNPTPQFFDSAGDPLVSGKMYYFESGTDTPKPTFADINLTIPNTHPVVLTADGRLPNVFFDGPARQKLTDSDDVQLWDKDPVGGENIGGNFEQWLPSVIYSVNDIVEGSDGNFYLSFTDGNENNDPTTSPAFWQQIEFINVWNVNVTYALGDIVKASDNDFYKSLVADNVGNDPVSSPTKWGDPFTVASATETSEGIAELATQAETNAGTDDARIVTPLKLDQSITGRTDTVITTADEISFADVSDSNKAKKDTVQGVLDLVVLPRNYIGGLNTSNGTDADHDIDIAVGECRDATDAQDIRLSAITKQIDAVWAVGTDAGGLDTGTVAANTLYAVWAILRSDTGVTDALYSTSFSAPTMPTDYDFKRLIGAVVTDASSNIISFTQTGNEFVYLGELIVDVNDGAIVDRIFADGTLSVPPLSTADIYASAANPTNTNAEEAWLHVKTKGGAEAATQIEDAWASYDSGGDFPDSIGSRGRVKTDASSQIQYATLEASGAATVVIKTVGFTMHTRTDP